MTTPLWLARRALALVVLVSVLALAGCSGEMPPRDAGRGDGSGRAN